jgi:hypothetical protein
VQPNPQRILRYASVSALYAVVLMLRAPPFVTTAYTIGDEPPISKRSLMKLRSTLILSGFRRINSGTTELIWMMPLTLLKELA